MKKHEANEARVVPVILRRVDWRTAPFAKLMALPKDGKPITTWKNRDEALLDVAEGIRRVVEDFHPNLGRSPRTTISPGPIVYDYQGAVVQIAGPGSRIVTKTAWDITEEHAFLRADDYITPWFNSAGDIMWVSCPDEFQIVGSTSPTGNHVFPMTKNDSDTPHGLHLKDQLQNTIVVTCKRKTETRVPPRVTGTGCPKCGDPMAPFHKFSRARGFGWPEQ